MGKKLFHCFLLDGTRHRSEPFHAFGDNNTSCEATMTFQKVVGPIQLVLKWTWTFVTLPTQK